MIGVMALIVIPIFMIVSAKNFADANDYPKNGIKHVGRYFVLGVAGIILFIDLLIIVTWLS